MPVAMLRLRHRSVSVGNVYRQMGHVLYFMSHVRMQDSQLWYKWEHGSRIAVLSTSISSEQIVQVYVKWLIPIEMDDDEQLSRS